MDFALTVAIFAEKTRMTLESTLRKISLNAYGKLVQKTPVDTGRARKNWRISVNDVDASTTEDVATAGPLTMMAPDEVSYVLGKLGKLEVGDTVYISNNLFYIGYLEDGHSQGQAPNGMLKLTYEELLAYMGFGAEL